MYNRNGIFDYYAGDSVIHKLNPVYKILSLVFMLVFLVMADSAIDVVVVSFFVGVMVIFSDIGISNYVNNLRVSTIFIVLVFIVSLLVSRSFVVGMFNIVKVIDFVIYLSLMTMTSSFNSVVYGVKKLLFIFDKFINVNAIALNIGLLSKFISILYNERVRIINSRELRGVMYRDMRLLDRFSWFVGSIIPIYKNSINKIKKIRMVMKVRNYNYYTSRCNYRLNKFGKTDTILLGINVVVLILVIIY